MLITNSYFITCVVLLIISAVLLIFYERNLFVQWYTVIVIIMLIIGIIALIDFRINEVSTYNRLLEQGQFLQDSVDYRLNNNQDLSLFPGLCSDIEEYNTTVLKWKNNSVDPHYSLFFENSQCDWLELKYIDIE